MALSSGLTSSTTLPTQYYGTNSNAETGKKKKKQIKNSFSSTNLHGSNVVVT